MQITLSPIRMDEPLAAQVAGDVLTLNGEVLDFSPLPDGALLPRDAIDCDWIAGDVRREAGVLIVPLLLPHGGNPPPETLYPQPLSVGDGPVPLPPRDMPPDMPAGFAREEEPADAEN